jgi:hypothetical protein
MVEGVELLPKGACNHDTVAPYQRSPGDYRQCDGVILVTVVCRGENATLKTLGFDFPNFASAWDALAGVTTAQLPEERRQEAKRAVMAAMYPDGDAPQTISQASTLNDLPFLRVSSCRACRAQPTRGSCSLPPAGCASANRAYRHILCHQSAQHAAGLDRGMGARSQVPSREHRSTSTALRLRRIAEYGSRP